MRGSWVVCFCAVAAIVPPPVDGQTAYGSITGIVRDAVTQAPVSAAVRYTNLSTGNNGATVSVKGLFTFSLLSPGTYRLSVSADGCQDRTVEQLELPVAGHFDVRVELWRLSDPWHSGAYSSVVMPGSHAVSAYYGPDIDTSRSDTFEPLDVNTSRLETAVSTVIGTHDISELPLSGRDVYTMLVLLPGVTADTATSRGLGISVAGQRPSSSNYLLDGLESNDMVITGPSGVLAPESVAEHRISTGSFSAEYGRTSGFLANAITHSGTGEWHGLGYFYLKNDRLNANGFQENLHAIARAPLKESQPGFSLSGPLLSRRLFASSLLELRRFSSYNDPQIYALPTAQFIAASDPGTMGGRLLRQYPAAVVPTGPGDARLVTIVSPASLDQALALARLDYVSPAAAHLLFTRVSVSRQRNPDLLFNPYPQFSSPYHQGAVSLAAGWTWQITPLTTHELRIGRTGNAARYDRPHAEIHQLAAFERLSDGRNSYAVSLPGSASSLSYRSIARNWEVVDNWGWSRGRHNWRLGGGVLWRTIDSAFTADPGDYLFSTLGDFAKDSPLELEAAYDRQAAPYHAVPYNRTYRYTQADAFAQDTFRATPRLTLNLGMRYDFYGPPVNTGPAEESLLQLGTGASLAERLSNAHYVQPLAGSQQLFDSDTRDWAARAGVSYDLTGSGRTVLRAAYGIFYDRPFDNLWQIVSINRQVAGAWFFSGPVNFLAPPLSVSDQGRFGSFVPQFHTPLLLQPRLRNPMVQNSFAGVARKLADGITLDVNALASRGRRLWSTDIVNRFGSLTEDQANPSGRYNPNLQEIDYRGNQGQSDYFALTSALHFQSSRWIGQVAYTWSHAIDNQSDALAGAFEDYNQERQANRPDYTALAGFTRQFDSGADRGNADFDQRQNLVFYGIYEAPAMFQSTAFRMLFREWRVSALGAIRSGLPFTVYAPTNGTGAFLLNQRADWIANAPAPVVASPVPGGRLLLNPGEFATPADNAVGTSGRNAFSGPGLISADLSVARQFPVARLGESGRLTVRADFYNAFNHANLNNPQSYLTGARFGQALFGRREQNSGFPILAPLNETARQMQILVRLEF